MLASTEIPAPSRQKIFTVSELNRDAGELIGRHFSSLSVAGEISNVSMPASGHIYFSLKDAQAQVRCAWFRPSFRKMPNPVRLENGKHVIVRAQAGLYEPRGDFQLIVETVEEDGIGDLQQAFEQLKLKLAAEGLFAADRKRRLPLLPRAIGVITSPTGAAVRDILSVLRRRFPAVPVIIYPAAVQGAKARPDLVEALAAANRHGQCEVLILARGGGSLEDLWAFNEEIVARAIAGSQIPVVSGVGHETDFTIADFVADLRAPTPTAAAEHVTPDCRQWLAAFGQFEIRINQMWQRQLHQSLQKLDWLSGRLQRVHPGQRLTQGRRRLNDCQDRLARTAQNRLQAKGQLLAVTAAQFRRFDPAGLIAGLEQRRQFLSDRLRALTAARLERLSRRLLTASQTLQAVSPLATLNRGYAIAGLKPSGAIIRSTGQVKPGDTVEVQVADGRFTSQVASVEPDPS